jgi:hypothetical protein
MRSRTARLLLLVIGCALAHEPSGWAQKQPQSPPALMTEDRGKFRAYSDGQLAGTEEFSISRSGNEWICRGSSEVKVPGATTEEVRAELRLGPQGNPVAYEFTTKGSRKAGAVASFSGTSATMELRGEGASGYSQSFQFDSPRIVVLDNNLFHHYVILARLYDWNAKGSQAFSVLIPQNLTPGTLTVEWGGPQQVGTTKYEMLRVRTSDLDVELYVANGRLERILAPTAKVEVKRE